MMKNKDRFEHFKKMYFASDLQQKTFYRLEAVDGNKLTITDFITDKAFDEISYAESSGHRTKHYQLSRGGVGCYLSHLMIYKHFMTTPNYYAFIFEDDAIFGTDLFYQTQQYLRIIPGDWDVTLLGCKCLSCDNHGKYDKVKKFFYTHALVINKKGIKKNPFIFRRASD